MKTLITGGAGFIGTHLTRTLLERGDDIVVLDSLEPQVHGSEPPALPDDVRLIHGDVGDPELADEALADVDRVVHLAAAVGVGQSMYEIDNYVRKNTMSTATFLERMVNGPSRPARLVVASSMSIYGEGEYECPQHGALAPRPRPESQLAERRWELFCPHCGEELRPIPTRETKPLVPTSIYAVTKRDHEELCLVTGAAYDVPTVALRFFNVYGPGQALSNPYTGVAAIFASRLMNGREPIVFEDGQQSRDFTHVSDIVNGITLALESEPAVGHTLNLGTGRPTTIERIGESLARGLDVEHNPRMLGQYRAGDIRHCFADPTESRRLLGFEAQVELDEGIRDLLDWLADAEAVDMVEQATDQLVARGLTR